MKNLTAVFVLFASLYIYGKSGDSLYVKLDKDTVKVFNTQVSLNCAFHPKYIIDLVNSSITIVQKDTFNRLATCGCTKDYVVKLTGLKAGDYHLTYYRSYPEQWKYTGNPDSLAYVGELNFNVPDAQDSVLAYSSSASGCYTLNDVEEIKPIIADDYCIEAYPNPFNPDVTISYYIPEDSYIRISVFDALGRLVRQIFEGQRVPGNYEERFGGKNLSSGIYYCRLEINRQKVKSIKLVLKK